MKHKLLTLASAAALLAACSDSTVSDANDEIKDKATVTFMVVDHNTNLPLEDVEVYFRPTDKTKYTDSAGTSVWKDVEIGDDIYWDFSYDGYVKKRIKYTITDQIPNDVSRVHDMHPRVDMYQLGVTIKGVFYYTDIETGNYIPADGVTIYAKYTGDADIYPNEVYTTTKDGGKYEFKNMAADVQITVKSERFVLEGTDIVYDETTIDSVAQRKGDAKEVIKELDPKAAPVLGLKPVLLSSNLSKIDSTTSLKLVFSEVLEKDSVKTAHIKVKNAVGKNVAVVVSYDEENKTVVIKPASGKWVDGDDYKVSFSVWSKAAIKDDDKGLDPDDGSDDGIRDFAVGTVKIPGKAENVKLDTTKNKDVVISFYGERTYVTLHDDLAANDTIEYNATINLIWKEVTKGVQGFNIYVQGDNASNGDFVFAKTVGATVHATPINVAQVFQIDDDDDPSTYDNLAYPLSSKNVKTVKIMVLPYNSAGEADASKADVITVKVGELAKKKMDGYENATIENLESIKPTNAYTCSGEKATTCVGGQSETTIKGLSSDDYFALNLSAIFASKKDDGATGYTAYYRSGSSSKWAELPVSSKTISSTVLTNGPFKENAMKYGSRDQTIEFTVVPYFTSADGKKISSTTLGNSIKSSRSWTGIIDDIE